eukprot:g20698.t1
MSQAVAAGLVEERMCNEYGAILTPKETGWPPRGLSLAEEGTLVSNTRYAKRSRLRLSGNRKGERGNRNGENGNIDVPADTRHETKWQ